MGGLAGIKELQSLAPGPKPSHQRSLGQYQVLGQSCILDFPLTACVHSRQPEPGPVRGNKSMES